MLRNANTKNRWSILASGWPSCRVADGNTEFLVAVKLAVFAVLYVAITLRVVLVGTGPRSENLTPLVLRAAARSTCVRFCIECCAIVDVVSGLLFGLLLPVLTHSWFPR
jgi:hypothetical protein